MNWLVLIGCIFGVFTVISLIQLLWEFGPVAGKYAYPLLRIGLSVLALLLVGHINQWYVAFALAGVVQILQRLDDYLLSRGDEARVNVVSRVRR